MRGRGGGRGSRDGGVSCSVALQAQRLLPQRFILRGELLPLPPNTGQLFGERVQPLPQLSNLVSRSVTLGANLEDRRKQIDQLGDEWFPS